MLLFSRGSNPSVNTLLLLLFLSCPLWITSSCKKNTAQVDVVRVIRTRHVVLHNPQAVYQGLLINCMLRCYCVHIYHGTGVRKAQTWHDAHHLSHRCSFSKSVRNSSNLKGWLGETTFFWTTPLPGWHQNMCFTKFWVETYKTKKRTILNIYINRK